VYIVEMPTADATDAKLKAAGSGQADVIGPADL
jgi:hypothetical protein